MPKDFSQLKINVPDFNDAEQFLKVCGTRVVDEIVAMIGREEQPDGGPQKQNAPGYRDAKRRIKGYTTPLKGISRESPYMARRATFVREMINLFSEGGGHSRALLIRLNNKRSEIGRKLTDRGYWFIGITKQAERNVMRLADQYFRAKVRQMRGGL